MLWRLLRSPISPYFSGPFLGSAEAQWRQNRIGSYCRLSSPVLAAAAVLGKHAGIITKRLDCTYYDFFEVRVPGIDKPVIFTDCQRTGPAPLFQANRLILWRDSFSGASSRAAPLEILVRFSDVVSNTSCLNRVDTSARQWSSGSFLDAGAKYIFGFSNEYVPGSTPGSFCPQTI
jgi:hypothetical protein